MNRRTLIRRIGLVAAFAATFTLGALNIGGQPHTEEIAEAFIYTGQKLTEYDPQAMADHLFWLHTKEPTTYSEDVVDLIYRSMLDAVSAFAPIEVAREWGEVYADLQTRLREG